MRSTHGMGCSHCRCGLSLQLAGVKPPQAPPFPTCCNSACAAVVAATHPYTVPALSSSHPPPHTPPQQEVKRFAKPLGLAAVAVFGGSGVANQISELKRGAEVVAATPGRFIDLLVTGVCWGGQASCRF